MSNQSSKFPSDAEVVIVGVGGIVGSMLAYWLAELGQKNIVGLEKSTIIPSDIASTAHASDLSITLPMTSLVVGQQASAESSMRTMDSF